MTENAIRHYFTDFPVWCAIHSITAPGRDDVIEWAKDLVEDNFISETEAAELVVAADEDPNLYKIETISGDAATAEPEKAGSESAATLGVSPMPGLKKAIEGFADKAGAAVKGIYDSNSVMMEDCEQDILYLNSAIFQLHQAAEKAHAALESLGSAMTLQKNEDTLKAISLLGDAIKELAGDAGDDAGEETGAPPDSLSSEVTAIYNDEPTAPDALPNPAEDEGPGSPEA